MLSYNILKGGEDRLPLILDVIRTQAPDVVALQEADGCGTAETLARELGMTLVYGESSARYCVAWLSRLPIVRSENYRHPSLRKSLLEIEVDWQDTPLGLFAAHLRPKITGEALRVLEIDAILELLHAASGRPHLLVGDFNTFHPDETYISLTSHPPEVAERVQRAYDAPRLAIEQLLAAGYVDCYRALHAGEPGYTFATRLPMARIDYVFASPEMATHLCGCGVVDSPQARLASDHFPIWAEFA
jgi:endonuclease/exonuclease/phosphatase family metal-dependent hydrolase